MYGDQVASLLAAWNAGSAPGDDNVGTTTTFAITIERKGGSILRLWGPEMITWALEVNGEQVTQHNIISEDLRKWFLYYVATAASPSAAASSPKLDRTPAPLPE